MSQSTICAAQSNPFSTRFVRPGAIPFQFAPIDAVQSLRQLADSMRQCPFSAIVGPHGTGKTTLLSSLRPLLSANDRDVKEVSLHAPPVRTQCHLLSYQSGGFRHCRSNERLARVQQAGLATGGLLIIDGLEQLSATSRRRILHHACRHHQQILATSHKPIRRFTTIFQSSTQPAVVRTIVNNLLRTAPSQWAQRVQHELSDRELTTVTNVRDLLFDLYDVVAQLQTDDPGKAIHRSFTMT